MRRTMYIGWRVFSARPGGIANAIVGKKSTNGGVSFTTSLPYPVALLLKPFDQPQGHLLQPAPPDPTVERLSDREHRRQRDHPHGASGVRLPLQLRDSRAPWVTVGAGRRRFGRCARVSRLRPLTTAVRSGRRGLPSISPTAPARSSCRSSRLSGSPGRRAAVLPDGHDPASWSCTTTHAPAASA